MFVFDCTRAVYMENRSGLSHEAVRRAGALLVDGEKVLLSASFPCLQDVLLFFFSFFPSVACASRRAAHTTLSQVKKIML